MGLPDCWRWSWLAYCFWSTLAVYFADTHTGQPTNHLRAAVFALASVGAVLFIRPRRYGLATFALLFLTMAAWFFRCGLPMTGKCSAGSRARVPWPEVHGDDLTVHNVRNFDYRTETDFMPIWEDRHYDLSKIRSVDFMLVYWGSPAIAHVMVSFGFEGDSGIWRSPSKPARRKASRTPRCRDSSGNMS